MTRCWDGARYGLRSWFCPMFASTAFTANISDRIPYHNYLTLVAEEVAGTVSRHYAIPFERERWAIGGFSFGGYLSLDVGRRYPGRFASVSVISGLVDEQWSFWPSQPPPPGPTRFPGPGQDIQSWCPARFPDFSSPADRMIIFSRGCGLA